MPHEPHDVPNPHKSPPSPRRLRPWLAPGILLLLLAVGGIGWQWAERARADPPDPDQLTVLWTSGDPEVAHRVALMYTHGAAKQKWFDSVRLIIWGPSARLLAADKDVQAYVDQLRQSGVEVQACVVCADSYGVTETLRDLGIEVKAMGEPLTRRIRDPKSHVITF